MLDFWKESLGLRIAVVVIVLAIVAAVVFVWNPFGTLGGLAAFARWGTLIGSVIAGIALIVNPLLEDYA